MGTLSPPTRSQRCLNKQTKTAHKKQVQKKSRTADCSEVLPACCHNDDGALAMLVLHVALVRVIDEREPGAVVAGLGAYNGHHFCHVSNFLGKGKEITPKSVRVLDLVTWQHSMHGRDRTIKRGRKAPGCCAVILAKCRRTSERVTTR